MYNVTIRLYIAKCPLAPSVVFLVITGKEAFKRNEFTTVRSQGYGAASNVFSHRLTLQPLQFEPLTDPAATPETLRLSQCLLRCFTLLLTFWLLSCFVCLAKHFISKKSAALVLTFPFAETEQSFTNHTTECKISKPFDIAGLMKWLAPLCCNYWKRSVPWLMLSFSMIVLLHIIQCFDHKISLWAILYDT